MCGRDVILSHNCNTNLASQNSSKTNFLSPGRSKVDKGMGL